MKIKGQDILEKNQYWILENKQNLTFQTTKDASNARNVDTQNSCKGKTVCAGCGDEKYNVDNC